MTRIDQRVGSLRDHPQIGPDVLGGHARMLTISRTRYVVFYRVERDQVVILRVMHGSQERPTEFGR